jgi:3-oxoacyl-[acyl-carrier-protein] synthase-1
MRRVVVTGLGIVSSIGNNKAEVTDSLRSARSGVEFNQEYADMGLRSHVEGTIDVSLQEHIDRRVLRFMGAASAFNFIAMEEAVADAGFAPDEISDPRIGLIVGSGGASPKNVVQAADLLRQRGVRKVGPYMVTRTMSSTNAACIGTAMKIKGMSYSISSACATSAHCIGHAAELIQFGKQDVVFAGGGEEVHWTTSVLFDAMGALSSKYNDTPGIASRPYDAERDGFVISGGGGILVMEEMERAIKRGARIYAELTGYGATSDGVDMVQPSGEGAVRCMRQAMERLESPIDYINVHGTSTPVGDIKELEALAEVFDNDVPPLSSTKSLTGHGLGAAGVCEAIYSLLMMERGFISKSANIDKLDPAAEGFPIVRETTQAELNSVMSNSFGFGGTNCTLVFSKV